MLFKKVSLDIVIVVIFEVVVITFISAFLEFCFCLKLIDKHRVLKNLEYSVVEIGISVLWHKGFISIFKSAWIVFDNIFYCFVRQIIYPLFVVSKILCRIICVNHWDEDIKIWRDWCTIFVTSFEMCSSGDPAKVFTDPENWDLKSFLCTVQCISSII